jgi:hypothetical protein
LMCLLPGLAAPVLPSLGLAAGISARLPGGALVREGSAAHLALLEGPPLRYDLDELVPEGREEVRAEAHLQ